jgi:hypothetical protein
VGSWRRGRKPIYSPTSPLIEAQGPSSKGRSAINIRAKFAVFYGKVDQKRDPGWYWTSVPGPGEPLKGPYNGPFKTKAEAVEDANQAPVIEENGPG